MVKVTMEQIINFRSGSDFFNGTNLPLKGAYKINKIRKTADKEADFYSEKFQEIIDKYAKKDENGELIFSEDENQIMINEDMMDECKDALAALQGLEIEVDNYNLKLEDLGEDLQCTPNELAVLMPFME